MKGLGDSNNLTVVGKVDPVKFREMLEKKTKKKVELVSPLPKKDKDKDGGGGGEKKAEGKPEKKPDEKKSKEVSSDCVALLAFSLDPGVLSFTLRIWCIISL